MSNTPNGVATMVDAVRAACSAAWSRSWPRQEIDRLVEEGFTPGQLCEIAFSLDFDEPETVSAATAAVRAAGYRVVEVTGAAKGFLTVQSRLPLSAYQISRASSRLARLARQHGAHAAMIGPVSQLPTSGRTPTPSAPHRGIVAA